MVKAVPRLGPPCPGGPKMYAPADIRFVDIFPILFCEFLRSTGSRKPEAGRRKAEAGILF